MLDARKKIVAGARSMKEELLEELSKNQHVTFDNAAKVQLATNLMTVLVTDNGTQPVVRV